MSDLDDAWQAALAAEHRAVFGYSVLGPRVTGADLTLAAACSDAHETVRDDTELALAAAGLRPVGPDADYPDVFGVTDAAMARVRAVDLEETAAAAWRFLYAQAAGSRGAQATTLRSTAQAQLTACAIRAVRWRVRIDPSRASTAFPGV